MIIKSFDRETRALKKEKINTDLVIVGGGITGVCAAIAAARQGVKVVLIQDRPVLGGNASSEVRLWILGATSHMGNNNRWSREGGIIDELLVENVYRNKEGNPVIFDTILLDKVKSEPNITILLNTAVYDLEKSGEDVISTLHAFCSQNYTLYEVGAKIFCDSSGDGIVAYKAGAGFRIGAEEKTEYGEMFAPDHGEYGELLGHSIYFYSKDTGAPVKFTAPGYALKDITKIPRYGNINAGQHGCKFWWLEYGGRLDTIHGTEDIKWELWSVVYGVWDYIKNSGKFPEAENMTLEWVGTIPGKRESRRFDGLYTMTQQDIIEQKHHEDAIAHGGWAIDLHPADGVYSKIGGCIQYHSKGVYEIPYRSFVSKDIRNLYISGRGISASHVAHGSTRVMATSGLGGQAVGVAAAQCIKRNLLPADLTEKTQMADLQFTLNLIGQSIPHTRIDTGRNKASNAQIAASSHLTLNEIPAGNSWYDLEYSVAQMLPLKADELYTFEIEIEASAETTLDVELCYAIKPYNYTPERVADKVQVELKQGRQTKQIRFTKGIADHQYAFLTFYKNDKIKIRQSDSRYTGILTVYNKFNLDVNNTGKQTPPDNLGIDSFYFWCPERRPAGQNLAMTISPAIDAMQPGNVTNGLIRPTLSTNAWIASPKDSKPCLELKWEKAKDINRIILYFDTDYDHALESVQMGHPENVMPFCIQAYQIFDQDDKLIYATSDNHQTVNTISFDSPVTTDRLKICVEHPGSEVPASIFQVYID